MPRTVSVVIPTYNYGRFIGEAIESALAQTVAASEIVVVDDGSTDNTESVVRAFGQRVQYVRQENAGVCAARNRGVAESVGDYVAFLDADDTWEPSKLEMQIARFALDSSIGLVHCGTREFDGSTGETIRINVCGGEDGLAENLLLWQEPGMPGPGGTIMLSRKAFEAVGGFDTRMKCGEDWDFCYRVAREFRVGFVAEPLVNYRFHPAAAHLNVGEMERGMSLFYAKAFATDDAEVLQLRRRSYGNFHRVLAGSYFHAHDYRRFVSHSLMSIWNRPGNLGYFLKFPVRRLPSRKQRSAPDNGSEI
jgi:glycosyltransferase involved in cell wall biosynthesis